MSLKLILASSSPYRRELLERLKIPFETIAPEVDETPQTNETPQRLVERLAIAKAQKIAAQQTGALVIGSDQVAVYNGLIVGKPHGYDKAVEQLCAASGRTATLIESSGFRQTWIFTVSPGPMRYCGSNDSITAGAGG